MVDQVSFPTPDKSISAEQPQPAKSSKTGQTIGPSFANILGSQLPTQGVKFSQHALERLKARNITLSANDQANLEGAVNNVAMKGCKNSLVMMGDVALIVGIKDRAVVTAMDKSQMQGKIFTNIDSAVIL